MSEEKKTLLIVESPSKAKTIGKYLGSNYTVIASMGHLRDLPKSTLGVDIANDFEPEYVPLEEKKDLIAKLKSLAAKSDKVLLATDPDREGEAISWHLKELLKLPDAKTQRVTFNEITKAVVQNAVRSPRPIDGNLVDAQQARRILDRIVGYELSPLLWKKVRRGLSAGRVQSVATRMVVDRENEIRAFVPEEYWTLDADLLCAGGSGFTAKYFKGAKKHPLTCEAEADAVIADVTGKQFRVSSVKQSEKAKTPAPPFTTSTLQQEASRKLNMSPKQTMSVAQKLYEGVEIDGRGTLGLITYMRTDSQRISEEALAAAGKFIREKFGDSFYPGSPRRFRTKGSAQDAHEAIRPTDITITPELAKKTLRADQWRLYNLIWSRFAASQMSAAVYSITQIDTECAGHTFRATHQSVKFPGYLRIYVEGRDDDAEEVSSPLPALTEGDMLDLKALRKEQHFTQPPARYTEATLVKAMEEKGVGRPSTYAAVISTIEDREYVTKIEKHLAPTGLGETVNTLLMEHFNDIIDIAFTAEMEEKLDGVEAGTVSYKGVLHDFYDGFKVELDDATAALEGKRLKVPEEVSTEVCELCGRNLVVRIGRFGKFLACPGFPDCTFTMPIVERMPGRCPKCGAAMLKRKSKNNYTYYACQTGKDCGFMSWDIPTESDCPSCGNTMFKKAGKGRNKPFCINPDCPNFLPEDKRGYYKKKTAETDGKKPAAKKTAQAKGAGAVKSAVAKKPAAKKTAGTAKKTAAKGGKASE